MAAALLLLLAWPAGARAQAPVRLASLQVSIWPEYDQPSALIILDGQLDPAAALPASLSVRLPARAGQPHAVAVTDAAGQLITAAYTTQPAGDDIIVVFQASSRGFRVEYYDPALAIEGEARQFAFDWQTDHAIDMALARVQQPRGARDLAAQPALTPLGAGQDGLEYHELRWGTVAAGDRLRLSLTYAKTGSGLTAPSNASAPQPQAANSNGPWILAGTVLGLALAGAGLYMYLRGQRRERQHRPARASARSRRRPRSAAAPQPRAAGPAAGFCTQCGQPRVAGDRFCRQCGAAAGP